MGLRKGRSSVLAGVPRSRLRGGFGISQQQGPPVRDSSERSRQCAKESQTKARVCRERLCVGCGLLIKISNRLTLRGLGAAMQGLSADAPIIGERGAACTALQSAPRRHGRSRMEAARHHHHGAAFANWGFYDDCFHAHQFSRAMRPYLYLRVMDHPATQKTR